MLVTVWIYICQSYGSANTCIDPDEMIELNYPDEED